MTKVQRKYLAKARTQYLNANETRQIIVEAVTEDGPWRAEIDTIEPYR